MLKRALTGGLIAALLFGLTGCNLPQWALDVLLGPPPPALQFSGNFASFGDDYYVDPQINQLQYAIFGAQGVSSVFEAQGGWSQTGYLTDCSVTANAFSDYNGTTDALYFQGHGLPGAAEFCEAFEGNAVPAVNQLWGPGNTSGKLDTGNGTTLNYPPRSTVGMPIAGRLKWLFLNSSNSVAGPSMADPGDPNWTANWLPAFGRGLHGLYGGWQAPGYTCTNDDPPNRSCDLTDGNGIGTYFADVALPPELNSPEQGEAIHDAWISAAAASNLDASWSMWEDHWARNDIISGPSANGINPPTYASKLSGTIDFDYPTPSNSIVMRPMTVHRDTFTLQPRQLQNESINHEALAQAYASYLSGAAVTDNGSVYSIRQGPATLQHWYGKSGAVIYSATSPQTTIAFSQATALQAATQFVQGTFGMPADATLLSTLQQWELEPQNGSSVLTGYEFIWVHQNGMLGGDAIKVMVADWQVISQQCTEWGWSGPPTHRICISWIDVSNDTPYITYGYRLWRTLGSAAPGIQPNGQTSIDALAASSVLPANAVITGYRQGLWTPSVDQSSALGARSAWIFTLNGTTDVGVDAATGAILGAVSLR